jgi:hypothetical protein
MRFAIVVATLVFCSAQFTDVCAADAGVEEVLECWQAAVANVRVYEASFQRYVYDHVFQVRTQGVGEVRLEPPHAGSLTVRPDEIPADPQQRKLKVRNNVYDFDKVYKIKADRAEIWEWGRGSRLSIPPFLLAHSRLRWVSSLGGWPMRVTCSFSMGRALT